MTAVVVTVETCRWRRGGDGGEETMPIAAVAAVVLMGSSWGSCWGKGP